MILNKSEYKKAVNKIVVSDELRNKIIHNSPYQITYKYKKNDIHKYFQKATGIVACFVFCLLSYHTITNSYHFSVDMPVNTISPNSDISDNANKSDIKDNTASIAPDMNNLHNNDNISDKQYLYKDKHTAIVTNPTVHSSVNNSVSKDSSLPASNTNKTEQSHSFDIENVEQDTFVPVLGASSSADNNVSTENFESVGCGAYSGENMSDIAEIENKLGYKIKIPNYVPDGYKTDSLSAPFDDFAEIIYTNETDTLYYRTAKGSEDISGDYNDYENVETVTVNDNDVTIKGNDNLYHNAGWIDDDEVFSIYSDNGVEKDTMIDIVESVD